MVDVLDVQRRLRNWRQEWTHNCCERSEWVAEELEDSKGGRTGGIPECEDED